jgi:hypothetical protein
MCFQLSLERGPQRFLYILCSIISAPSIALSLSVAILIFLLELVNVLDPEHVVLIVVAGVRVLFLEGAIQLYFEFLVGFAESI